MGKRTVVPGPPSSGREKSGATTAEWRRAPCTPAPLRARSRSVYRWPEVRPRAVPAGGRSRVRTEVAPPWSSDSAPPAARVRVPSASTGTLPLLTRPQSTHGATVVGLSASSMMRISSHCRLTTPDSPSAKSLAASQHTRRVEAAW